MILILHYDVIIFNGLKTSVYVLYTYICVQQKQVIIS